MDSFLNLFKTNQIDLLKQKTNYDEFIRICEEKNTMPLNALDTPEELKEVKKMIAANRKVVEAKIA